MNWATRIGAPVSVDADELAAKMGVTREAMDEWAIRSQRRYAGALKEDKYREEIVPFEITPQKGPAVLFEKDAVSQAAGHIRKISRAANDIWMQIHYCR